MARPWLASGALLAPSWCVPGPLLVRSGPTPCALLAHSWCGPCTLLMHSRTPCAPTKKLSFAATSKSPIKTIRSYTEINPDLFLSIRNSSQDHFFDSPDLMCARVYIYIYIYIYIYVYVCICVCATNGSSSLCIPSS